MKLPLLLFAFTFVCFTISCETQPQVDEYPKYMYYTRSVVPDTMKPKMAQWITETIRASNQQMTGGGYEDPEDVIEATGELAERLFSVEVEGLNSLASGYDQWVFTPVGRLSPRQRKMFVDPSELPRSGGLLDY